MNFKAPWSSGQGSNPLEVGTAVRIRAGLSNIMKKKLTKELIFEIERFRNFYRLNKLPQAQKSRMWKFHKTKHFDFYIHPLNRKIDPKHFEKTEKHFEKILKTFNLKYGGRITVVCVKDRKEMKKLIGMATNGIAGGKNFGIYFSIFIYHPHEMVHVIMARSFNRTNSLFNEGLATLYGWDNELFKRRHIDSHTNSILKNKPISIKEIMDNKKFNNYSCITLYPYSASFLKYIREIYGLKKLKSLYKKIKRNNETENNIRILELGLGKKIGQIQKGFMSYVKSESRNPGSNPGGAII